MRKRLLLPTLLVAAAMCFSAGEAEARHVAIEPVSWNYLMVACLEMDGHFGIAGSHYSCIVEDCDGEGNACTIICDNEGGLETCDADVPRIHSTGFSLYGNFLGKLGMKRLPAITADGGGASSSSSHKPHKNPGGKGGKDEGGGRPAGGTHSTDTAGMASAAPAPAIIY